MKEIKTVEFVLETNESVIVPYDCFKEFKIGGISLKEELLAYKLECLIEIDKNIAYGATWSGNTKHPFYRLYEENDITQIQINYDNGTKKELNVEWGGLFCTNTNEHQVNSLIDCNTLHIHIDYGVK